jgi:uncharacterized protein (TIGR00266 family)
MTKENMMKSHELSYKLFGDDLQFVEIELDPSETVIAEAGGMIYMEEHIKMESVMGVDSNKDSGLMGKLISAGKRVVTGESLFMTTFTNTSSEPQHVAFGSPYPGKIVPLDLSDYDNKIICQKDAFLCAAKGTRIGIDFQRKIGKGFFGGEGFIMQRLDGDGAAFLHAGGTIIKKELSAGEMLRVDTGCIVAFTKDIDYDIQFVGNVKSALFGGEGLFFATVRGPGHVWLQSLPFSRLADRILKNAPSTGGKATGEGSLLGSLGNLIDGK